MKILFAFVIAVILAISTTALIVPSTDAAAPFTACSTPSLRTSRLVTAASAVAVASDMKESHRFAGTQSATFENKIAHRSVEVVLLA